MDTPAYDENNIFAKMLRGEIPCFKVYEDEHTLAFMDIMPRSKGHTLIIPKAGSRNLLDADPATLTPLFLTAQKIAKASKEAFNADGVFVGQFSEAASGQTVFHLHIHVIPRFEGSPLKPEGTKGDMADVEESGNILRAYLDNA